MFLMSLFVFVHIQIILHGNDWDTLFEHISPKHLPVRYGGEVDIPNIPGEMMVEMMQYYEKDFEGKSL